MRCPTCGAESASGKRFCADCGASLPVRCPKCDAESQSGKSFCADCGAPLDAPSLPRKEPSLPRTEGLVRVAENSWVGRKLAIGDEVVLRITIPCPRCVNMILPQADLPHDPGILRTVAQLNMRDVGDFGTLPCAGVYADVAKPGTIRRGDVVHYLDWR